MSRLQQVRGAFLNRLRKQSIVSLVRLACWVALVGLAVMAASIIKPAPLIVIFAMSVGQVIGIVAFLCFLLSILLDVLRSADSSDTPAPAQKLREASFRSDDR
jgi:hypothetical protein